MSTSNTIQEFIVRAPSETNKTYGVMRFNGALNVDIRKWKQAKMQREHSAAFKEMQAMGALKAEKEAVDLKNLPKFGAGSEFGKDEREEARRKRFERYQRKFNPDAQPWLLKVGGKVPKKFKGVREGGVSENASYYVFFQAPDGAFEAFPIKEWYNFTPVQRFKPLSAEEAEEKFEKRHKILNLFTVMKNKESEGGGEGEGEGKRGRRRGEFKVTDMDDWGMGSDAEFSSGGEGGSGDDTKSKKKGKGKNKGKKKKNDSDDDDSEAKEESDEGDYDDKEVDYMSDYSSDEDLDDEEKEPEDELKGVGDEDALRQLALTDSEEEENEENKEKEGEAGADGKKSADPNAKDPNAKEGAAKVKPEPKSGSSSSSSGSDDDSDLDESKFHSSIFMQKKINEMKSSAKGGGSDGGSGSSSRAATPTAAVGSSSGAMKDDPDAASGAGSKRKLSASGYDSGNGSGGPSALKKQKSGDADEGITEDAVRRYLMRKPMTTTELLQKFRSKNKKMTKSSTEMVTLIAQILKKLNPDKQKIKDKLYLSLKS